MTNLEAIDELNKLLDQVAALVEVIARRDFVDMSEEVRQNYTSVLADTIEQAKVAAEFLKR